MKLRSAFFGLLISCIMPLAMANPAQELQDKLAQTQAMNAKFSQRVFTENSQSDQISQGEMWVQKPNQFRWDVDTPFVQQIFVNQDKMIVFDVDLDQAIVQTLSDEVSEVPAHLLSGDSSKIDNDYHVTKSVSSAGEAYVLMPKSDDALFISLEIGFNKDTIARYMKLEDNLGQTTLISFYDIEKKTQISPSIFEPNLPQGIDIIEQ
ncbi:MAG: outer membrane lipoprotein chaperone LolA [Pseudomonadota bacterium]|nr:outer membrane lipoprotein chaperone LolA [Pseudomonadota bacterium]